MWYCSHSYCRIIRRTGIMMLIMILYIYKFTRLFPMDILTV